MPDAMRPRALETLAALVGGAFREKMRIEAAAVRAAQSRVPEAEKVRLLHRL